MGERSDLRERLAEALADANKAWPTMEGSPVKELFLADAVLSVLSMEQDEAYVRGYKAASTAIVEIGAERDQALAALREAGQYEQDTVEVTVRRDDGSVQFYEVRRARKQEND